MRSRSGKDMIIRTFSCYIPFSGKKKFGQQKIFVIIVLATIVIKNPAFKIDTYNVDIII